MRTAAHPGLKARVALAFSMVMEQPRLWAFGALGFSVRGGIAVLLAPVIVLPTQVEVRALLGNSLGSAGFTVGFWFLVAGAAAITTALILLVVFGLARLELASFQRLDGVGLPQPNRERAMFRLFAVQLLTVIALAAAAVPLALSVGHVAYDEIIRPSSTLPIYSRILSGVTGPLVFFVVAIFVLEALSSIATREVLAHASRLSTSGTRTRTAFLGTLGAALARPLRSPVRTIATAAIAWLATAVALVPAAWLIGLAWRPVRATFLTSLSFGDLHSDLGMYLVAVGLAGAFALALLATGFASALRGALWSVERLS
jgi:hypothetical protein